MITDSVAPGTYRLLETTRGIGIHTQNLENGTDASNAVDFIDSDNIWNNFNPQEDEVASDAHWGAQSTYDYFLNNHNRNSIDNNGFQLNMYVHLDQNFLNAYWDGTGAYFGDGDNTTSPLTTLDIVGHEISHGLTEYSANLIYQDESGALNESFSDIFGTAIEFEQKSNPNWLVGSEIGLALRSMSNPGAYGDPDCYNGTNFYVGPFDNGGVHINSGVQNFWFYLLSEGGAGTNDLNDAYQVDSIGMEKAAQVAFRNLTVYLTQLSDYQEARFFAIRSAVDLFGPCSPEVEAVTDAWYAVGLGVPYVPGVIASFSTLDSIQCQTPATVRFTNTSNNGLTYFWDFGDGSTSTAFEPTHVYTANGDYTVTLIVTGGSCGSDTFVKNQYISVQPSNPCNISIPTFGGGIAIDACSGFLHDNGGPFNDYTEDIDSRAIIQPTGATRIFLTFSDFDFETGFDSLIIYDGPTIASPRLGAYTGNQLPNGGVVSSTGGAVLVRQLTDGGVNGRGFSLLWECSNPSLTPVARIGASPRSSCSGDVQFSDLSLNSATSWLWSFGDGESSTLQNPIHQYEADGVYTVTLTVTNASGQDALTETDFIVISGIPTKPADVAKEVMMGSQTRFEADLSLNNVKWYQDSLTTTLVSTGNQEPNYIARTDSSLYYTQSSPAPDQNVGPLTNIGQGGFFPNNTNRFLIFDALADFKLKSVRVVAQDDGVRTFTIRRNDGSSLVDTQINLVTGNNVVELNWAIPQGSSYQFRTGPQANLYRNNGGAVFPYVIPGLVSINGTNAGDPSFYYFFYYWVVQGADCESAPAKYTINVKQPEVTNPTVTRLTPNPAVEYALLELDDSWDISQVQVDVVDAAGRIVWTMAPGGLNRPSLDLPVSVLASGVYPVIIRQGSRSQVFKLEKL